MSVVTLSKNLHERVSIRESRQDVNTVPRIVTNNQTSDIVVSNQVLFQPRYGCPVQLQRICEYIDT